MRPGEYIQGPVLVQWPPQGRPRKTSLLRARGASQSSLWHGLLTVPPRLTEGLHASITDSGRPSVRSGGTVRRPCHNAARGASQGRPKPSASPRRQPSAARLTLGWRRGLTLTVSERSYSNSLARLTAHSQHVHGRRGIIRTLTVATVGDSLADLGLVGGLCKPVGQVGTPLGLGVGLRPPGYPAISPAIMQQTRGRSPDLASHVSSDATEDGAHTNGAGIGPAGEDGSGELHAGLSHLRAGDYERAIAEFTSVLRVDPPHSSSLSASAPWCIAGWPIDSRGNMRGPCRTSRPPIVWSPTMPRSCPSAGWSAWRWAMSPAPSRT